MTVYRDRVLPHLMNRMMDDSRMGEIRQRVCAGLHGEVAEIGFGSGLNLPHLPAAVSRVYAVEPSAVSVRLATDRMAAASADVQVVGVDGQRLPLEDGSVDAVLCTWSLCTIPDPEVAVAEMQRVLRPGGRLYFVEHGLAPDGSVRRWQRRLDGVQQRVAGGCHLTRDIPRIIRSAGMEPVELSTYYYAPGSFRPYAAMSEGVAVSTTLP